jgi:hypothetical protein
VLLQRIDSRHHERIAVQYSCQGRKGSPASTAVNRGPRHLSVTVTMLPTVHFMQILVRVPTHVVALELIIPGTVGV